jgi:heme/copper-type cytochrome/quinol oxidase subunit 4
MHAVTPLEKSVPATHFQCPGGFRRRLTVNSENDMSDHDHSGHKPPAAGSFWKSRAGLVLIVFLAVAGLLLAYEHRVHILSGNGSLIGLLALCVGMHLFMHGGHGGHGGGSNRRGQP